MAFLLQNPETFIKVFIKVYQNQQRSQNKGLRTFWLSDFQKSSFEDFEKLGFDSAEQIYLLPLKADETQNIYTDSVWLDKPFYALGGQISCFARVNNTGASDIEDLTVRLFVEGKQIAQNTIKIPARGHEIARFDFVADKNSKTQRAYIEIEDYPISFDNVFYFSFEAATSVQISHISSANTSYVKKVYQTEDFFSYEHFDENNIEYSKLVQSDLIILEEVNKLNPIMKEKLKEALSRGTKLFIIPSENIDPKDYQHLGISFSVSTDTARYELATPNENDAFFDAFFSQVFQKLDKNISMPFAYSLIDWDYPLYDLLKTRKGNGFLLAYPLENDAYIYLMASSLRKSDIAEHALFLPILYKMAMSTSSKKTYHTFEDDIASFSIDTVSNRRIFTLKKDSIEIIPQQSISARKLLIEIPKEPFLSSGHYTLSLQNTDAVLAYLSLNYGKDESKIKAYNEQELTDKIGALSQFKVLSTESDMDFMKAFKGLYEQQSYWRYMLVLAIFCLLVESLLIYRRRSRL